jgi:hypothetical protein
MLDVCMEPSQWAVDLSVEHLCTLDQLFPVVSQNGYRQTSLRWKVVMDAGLSDADRL